MPASTPRTRLIFQNSSIFTSPAGQSGNTATGAFYSSGNSGNSFIGQISRVQNAELSVGINRTDVNIFGQLNRIDAEVLNPPSISMNFGYLLTDGQNENVLGFAAKGGASFVSGLLTKTSDAKNYFVSYSPQGIDDDGYAVNNQRDSIGIGNAFITNYSINASVGQPVTAAVSVEGLNIVAYTGNNQAHNTTPAVDPVSSNRITAWTFALPVASPQTGANSISMIKPGDITLSIPTTAGFLTQASGAYGANIQSFSLSIPIGRNRIQKLGAPFGISSEIQFPVDCQLSVQALQTDVQAASLDQFICTDTPVNLAINMRQPSCQGTGLTAVNIGFNAAYLVSQSIGQSIGGDATVSWVFSSQLSGPTSLDGIVFSGSY